MANKKILVVEDQVIVAQSLQAELEKWGYDVPTVALSGEEALDRVAAERPDLILMDINLGDGIDGVEAAQAVVEDHGVPVVFLTAYSDEGFIERITATHPYGYLLKPYKKRELQVAVDMAFYRHRVEKTREALHAIRKALWDMQRVGDIEQVMRVLFDALIGLKIPFMEFGINLVDPSVSPVQVRFLTVARDGTYLERLGGVASELVLRLWRSDHPVYRPDLLAEDPLGERDALSAERGRPVRAVLDLPFTHGTLALNSSEPDAFGAEDRDILAEIAGVLSEAFSRLEDMSELAERTRALELESAERRQAEDVLRRSEARFRRLVEHTNDMLFLHDLVGNFVDVNQSACDKLQYGRDELLQMAVQDVEQEFSPDLLGAQLDELQSGRSVELEGVHRRRDGTTFPVEVHLSLLEAEEGPLILASVRDATERKRAEEAMRVNLGLQRVRNEILRMESDACWDRVAAVFYRELSELVEFYKCGFNIVDLEADRFQSCRVVADGLVWAEDIQGVDPVLRQALETGRTVYRRNREEIDRAHAHPMPAKFQSVLDAPFSKGTIALNSTREDAFDERDIRVVEQFALVFNEAYRRLEDLRVLQQTEAKLRQAQKMETIGELTAGIAHNFNNILMASIGNVDMAMQDAPEEIRDYLQMALEAGKEASELVKELMIFSRTTHVEREPVDLLPIARETADVCKATFDRRIEISVLERGALPPVEGHAGQLKQMLLNLCINARDAVEAGVARVPQIEIELQAVECAAPADEMERPSGCYVRARVRDNGVGMDEATRSRVFDPFFTTKEVGEGTGLGLATVYGIVQQHAGWLDVESALGQGTTFEIHLPVAARNGASHHAETREEWPGGSETLLVIDDDDRVRQVLENMLGQAGYEVIVAADGADGLAAYERERGRIDLVLLDLSMPVLSGQEVLARIHALDGAAKIVVLTGYASDASECEGALALVHKPLRISPLLQTVRGVLDG